MTVSKGIIGTKEMTFLKDTMDMSDIMDYTNIAVFRATIDL
jgi:hypothetical protein